MDFVSIILIAIALAMDSFVVSVSSGAILERLRKRDALKIALFFGFFQAMMPIVGWLIGISIIDLIAGIDHWVAFGLLGIIGIKMIHSSLKPESTKIINPLNNYVLLLLAIATSIDALAVGLSFAFLDTSILVPVLAIGIITFILSFAGVFFGKRIGSVFGKKIGIVGGLILIGIGIKIVLEHLF